MENNEEKIGSAETHGVHTFEDVYDFVGFLENKGKETVDEIKENIPQITNLVLLKKASTKKPCKCRGQAEGQMEKRKNMLLNFYKKFMQSLNEEQKNRLKDIIMRDYTCENIIFNSEKEQILELK